MSEYDALFEEAGRKHNVDPALLRAIAHQESRFNPKAVSPQGALGLMQIMPRTAAKLGVDPNDPTQAVDGAARLISESLGRNGNVEDAVSEYHGGPNRKIWGPKNRAYRSEVMAKYGGQAPVDEVNMGPSGVDDILFGEGKPKPQEASQVDNVLFGENPEKVEMTGMTPFREVKGAKVPGFLSKEQEPLFAALNKGGGYKPNDPEGSPYNMYFLQDDAAEKEVPAGKYYVTRGGEFKRAPGGEEDGFGEKVGRGLARGGGDVALSVANLFPGGEDSTIRNRLLTNQNVYDADLKGDTVAGGARLVGQIAGSVPMLAGGEAMVAPTLAKTALGRFAMGEGVAGATGAGRILGKGASLATRGAAEGAGAAALVSSASDEPLAEQIATGAIVGGVLGPLAPAVLAAGRKAGGAVKDAAGRWTYGGREKIVSRLIDDVAPGGYNLDTRELVPGSFPTMGEAAGEAGISALERNARTNPKLAQVFQERLDANANARREFFETVAKDPAAISDAETAREAATGKLRDAAFKAAKPADAGPTVAKIDEILAGPSGKRDVVVRALKNIRSKLVQEVDTGGVPLLKPEADVQQLYGVRKSIDDMLSPLGSNEAKGATLATRELMDVKSALDKAIEGAAPGFKKYLKTYSDMSKPIDEMKLLQGMKLNDQQGNLTLAKVNSAVEKLEARRGARGASKEKSVSAETLAALKNLQADLKRASNIMKGKAPGSDTAQNLTMNRLAEGGGVPLGVGAALSAKIPGAGLVLGAANKAVSAQNEKMLQQLSSRLLQPELPAVKPVALKPRRNIPPVGQVLLPAMASIGANNITGAK